MKKLFLFLLGLSSLVFGSFCSAFGGEIYEVSEGVLFPENISVGPSDVINFDLSDVDFMGIDYSDVFFSAGFGNGVECDEDQTACWCNNSFGAIEYSVAESISVTVPNYDGVTCGSFYFGCTDEAVENGSCYEGDINGFYEYSITQSSGGGEGGNESGNNSGNNSGSNPGTDIGDSILPGGSLTPVISNLATTISEFIPYVIYVGFGILGVIIGFVAIMRLINWLRNKTLTPFR